MTTTAVQTHQDVERASRFDIARARVGLWAVVPLMLLALLLPADLPWDQRAMLAVLSFVVLFWITETIPIPVTALIGIALLVILGVAPAAEVYSAFGSPTVFLVIGAFILARAMTVHGLDRRFALRVLSLPRIGDSTILTALAFMVVAALLAMLVSASATAAMLLPIGIGVVRTVGDLIHDPSTGVKSYQTRFSCMLMLAIAYGAGVGSVLTPITGIANVIGRGTVEEMTGYQIPLFDWVAISGPYVLALGAVMFLALWLLNRPETRHIPNGTESFRASYAELGGMTRGEKIVTAVFVATVVLWTVPGVVSALNVTDPAVLAVVSKLNEGSVVLVLSGLLFLLPAAKGLPTMEWSEAAKIDWGTVVLVGVGLTIGAMMKATGLAETIGDAVADATGVNSTILLCLVAIILGMVISETTSNTASVGIVVPIVIPIAVAIGVDPLIPAMAAIFGGNAGAMLPVSTPPNAIVYGSGYVPMLRMIRTGLVADLLTVPLIILAVVGVGTAIGLALP
ncbi:SLC13 family permease [Microbacterium atlanticum]|uniref:SLC13 family permease n=1 Tax=Microbacterium atlanticum TaxID=2782168 RepID=UPI00188793CA|nr:DASS family sodium-coupled anion symporter [Microbacterium atlanticum]